MGKLALKASRARSGRKAAAKEEPTEISRPVGSEGGQRVSADDPEQPNTAAGPAASQRDGGDAMTWTKIDDEDTEASWDLSDGAYRLHHSGLVYCNHHLTDGYVPASRLAVLMPAYDPAFLAELLAADKWGAVTGGYQIANFLRDQPSKSGGHGAAARRTGPTLLSGVATIRSKPVSKPVTEREFSSERERDPDPYPYPV